MTGKCSVVCFLALVGFPSTTIGSWMNQSKQITINESYTSLETVRATHLYNNQTVTISNAKLDHQNQKIKTRTTTPTPHPPKTTPAPFKCPLSFGFILHNGHCIIKETRTTIIWERIPPPPRSPAPVVVSSRSFPPPPKTTQFPQTQPPIIPEIIQPPPRSSTPAIFVPSSSFPPPPPKTTQFPQFQPTIIPERIPPPRSSTPAIFVPSSSFPSPPPKTTQFPQFQPPIIPERIPPPRSSTPAIFVPSSSFPPPSKTTQFPQFQPPIIPERIPPPRSSTTAIFVKSSSIPSPPKTTQIRQIQQPIIPERIQFPRSHTPAIVEASSRVQPTAKSKLLTQSHQQNISEKPTSVRTSTPTIVGSSFRVSPRPNSKLITQSQQQNIPEGTMPPRSSTETRRQQSNKAHTFNISQLTTPTTIFQKNQKKAGIRYQVFDDYKNMSREVKCFKNFIYESGKCMMPNTTKRLKLTATLFIMQQQNSGTSNGKHDSYVSWLHLLIATHFSRYNIATVSSIKLFQSEANSMIYQANFEVIVFHVLNLRDYISKLISEFHEKSFSTQSYSKNSSIPTTTFFFQYVLENNILEGSKMKSKYTFIQSTSTRLTYSFHKKLFCPMVVLERDEVIFNNKSQLCLITFDVCFDFLVYYVGNSVQVCMEDYFSKLDSNNYNLSKLERNEIWVYRYTPEGLLSLVLMCISSLCLLITLVVYFICPELRSLPGKCIIFLSASLLIAQLLFQFGITLNDYPVVCKVVGFVVHYAWLASFFWMSASSVQMFLQFGRFTTRQSPNNPKRMLKYCLYAFGCPFLFIATNMGYSLVKSDGMEYGYGLDLCYISYPIMAIVTLITPVFIMTLTNIILFVIVCCRIGNHKSVQSVKSQLNKSKVVVKLSCLTGSLWIVGFVNYWLKLSALEYLFILLNASQGVFIMVSFVCTKRTFSMLRHKFNCTRCNKKQNIDCAHKNSI